MEKQQQFQMNFQLQKQRAQSYLISQNQKSVENRRQQAKDQQSVTANAALASAMSTEKSLTNEVDMLRMKLMKEAHDTDMKLKEVEINAAKNKQKVMEDIAVTLKSLREQAD